MATLGSIRKRSGLLLAVIGIAMLAFILGDFMQSKRSGTKATRFIGEVHDEYILRESFELKVEEGLNNWKTQNPQGTLTQTLIGQIRSSIWDQYVKELIMNYEYKKIGLDVSDEEWMERISGINVHSEISKVQAFQSPSGEFDRMKVLAYLKQIDQDPTGEAKTRWIGFQKYLIDVIKLNKYNNLLAKSMYISKQHVAAILNENNENIKFNYISIPYSAIQDSLAEPNDKEIKNYYNDHKAEYQQESSKDADFVVFPVIASNEDDQETKNAIGELIEDFKFYDDYDLMCRRNSDNRDAIFSFLKQDELVDKDTNWIKLFSQEEGSVIGPYLSSKNVYRISKLVNMQNRPDSVEARHILIKLSDQVTLDSAQNLIESFKIKIEKGADFGDLAEKKSEDKGSAIKGGDLGWFEEGVMVNEFNDVCFTAKKNELNIVTSQFGVHLIQVTKISRKVKKAKIAFIDRNVEPSTETFNQYYLKAAQFAKKILNDGASFDSLSSKQNLVKRAARKVTKNKEIISGVPNSREMVRWMNNAEEGDVSEVFQFDNSFVVAVLTRSYEEGNIPLQDLRTQIKSKVSQIKKTDFIQSISNGETLRDLAKEHGVSINTADATLGNLTVNGIGYEPELVGAVSSIEKGSVSTTIQGRNGVYFVQVVEKDGMQKQIQNLAKEQNKMISESQAYLKSSSYNVLKEAANIKDNRSDFY